MDASPQPRPLPKPDPASVFGSVAGAYDRARPSYPREAVEWLTGTTPATVVELGAGTGKLTDRLVELGHDVLATDPSDEMLQHLRLRHPDLPVVTAPAEAIPAATRSVDTVVAAQSFHWFDTLPALREAARVLRPEGRIALVWNRRDDRVPWVRRLGQVIGARDKDIDPTDVLVSSRLFGYVEDATFRFWQPLRRETLRDLVLSRSNVAALDPRAQDRVLRKVDDLFEQNQAGPDGLILPYLTRCFRAVVRPRGLIEEPEHSADLTAAADAVRAAEQAALRGGVRSSPDGRPQRTGTPAHDQGSDSGPSTTLIDFR